MCRGGVGVGVGGGQLSLVFPMLHVDFKKSLSF